jgi:ferric-dicitrate binding protein FerR (iron transport regulator)
LHVRVYENIRVKLSIGKLNMNTNRYTELIARKLSTDITEAEEEILDNWLKKSDENQEEFKMYSLVWSDSKIKRVNKNADNVFEGILNTIQEEKIVKLDTTQNQDKIRSISYLWKGIAAAILVLVVAVFVFRNIQNKVTPELVHSIRMHEKSLPSGQKMKIFLPDGSTIWLNAESTITYPERFDNEQRLVTLKGEGFFDVIKNPTKPFIVRTENMDVTVLGTSFNVRNYQSEGKTDVALESGKVMVETSSSKKNKYILSPGEGLSMNNKSGKIGKYEVDPKVAYQWKDGVIYFYKADFDEVINKLSRWYGVEFIIENYKGDEWEYSAEFKNDYLENILKSIGFSKGFEHELDQNIVTIKFN